MVTVGASELAQGAGKNSRIILGMNSLELWEQSWYRYMMAMRGYFGDYSGFYTKVPPHNFLERPYCLSLVHCGIRGAWAGGRYVCSGVVLDDICARDTEL